METYQQPILIYNPAAGKLRRHPGTLQRTIRALERASLRPRLVATDEAGHATELAREAVRDGADLILVLGGDGTINEAMNGILGSDVPMGVLPGGTANVLAMELGLGSHLRAAAERLAQCSPRKISIGRLCGPGIAPRHFLMMAGSGLDARIVNDLNPWLKSKTGKFAYWFAGFSQITKPVGQLEARVNGTRVKCGFALASRVRNYGGDLELACGASLLADEFELLLFEGSNPLRYVSYMLAAGFKQVQKMPGVHTLRTDRVELGGGACVQIDGEAVGPTPAHIEIVPRALTLLVPDSYR